MGFAGFGGGADSPNPPSFVQKAASLVRSLYRWATEDGFSLTADDVYRRRLDICQSNECGKYSGGTCGYCGCQTELKLKIPGERCPDSPPRWLPVEEAR